MESRFGHDFSQVRVHTDARAAASAQAVNAIAYTVGRDIVFNEDAYDPHSAAGQFLLAHELAHTLQQAQAGSTSATGFTGLRVSAADDRSEAEADDIAAWLFSGKRDDGAAHPRVSHTAPRLARFDCSRLDYRRCKAGVYKCGYGDSGTCGWVGPSRGGCICVGAIKPPVPPVPVQEPATQEARVRVRVRSHPDFEDYGNRLPYMDAPPGREFIVVIDAGLFMQIVAEAEALRLEQTKRLLRPTDPRNIPFVQVQPVLIGGAVVAGIIAIPLLAVMLGPAIVALVEAAAAVVASAASAVAATVASAGASWGVATVTRAVATAIVVRLVAGGMSEAEAAEAVKPLVGKRIVALADVTDHADMANAKPGQEISVEGQAFRAIIRLSAPRP